MGNALDIASLGWSLHDLRQDPHNKWNWVALATDVGSLALPFVAGGGTVVRAATKGDDISDAFKYFFKWGDNVIEGSSNLKKYSVDPILATKDAIKGIRYTSKVNNIITLTAKNAPDTGTYIFVQELDGTIKIAQRGGKKLPHPLLAEGRNVLTAGELTFKGGKVIKVSDKSGHYKPAIESLQVIGESLESRGLTTRSTKYLHYTNV